MNFVEVHAEGTGDGRPTRRPGRLVDPAPAALPGGGDAAGRQDARRRLPARAPRHRRGRQRPTGSFQARADVVEYLGNEELLHISAADQDVVGIVGSEHRVRPGDIVNLVLPLDKLHLFDGETGLTLAPDVAVVA